VGARFTPVTARLVPRLLRRVEVLDATRFQGLAPARGLPQIMTDQMRRPSRDRGHAERDRPGPLGGRPSDANGGACVETASDSANAVILVRDTTDRAGGTLAFTVHAWQRFTSDLR
jgi:hypothetical protein